MKLPKTKFGGVASTPQSAQMISTFGGFRHNDVSVSRDELFHLRRIAGMTPDSPNALVEGRDDLTSCRLASRDGMRIMAMLARHLAPGEDPVKLVAKMAIEYGLDLAVDPDWVNSEDGDDETEAEDEEADSESNDEDG